MRSNGTTVFCFSQTPPPRMLCPILGAASLKNIDILEWAQRSTTKMVKGAGDHVLER